MIFLFNDDCLFEKRLLNVSLKEEPAALRYIYKLLLNKHLKSQAIK